MMRRVFATLMTLAVFPAAAAAQMCVGNAPIGDRSGSAVHGGAGFNDGFTDYSTGFTMGSEYLFSAGFGYTDIDGADFAPKTVSAGAARQMTLGQSGAVACPLVGVAYGFGWDLPGTELTTWSVTPAMSVAYPVAMSPTFALVPFGQLGLVWTHASVDSELGSGSDSDTNGFFGAGISMLFNDMVTVGPTVRVPFGVEGAEETIGITASFGIPSR